LRACVSGVGKPLRNDVGLRAKIRRLSWLVASAAVAVYLNTPRPLTTLWPPTTTPSTTFILFLNVRIFRDRKERARPRYFLRLGVFPTEHLQSVYSYLEYNVFFKISVVVCVAKGIE